MPWDLAFEGILIVLLVVFLFYAMMLNKRLGNLRESRGELEKLIHTFADATSRADKSIHGFKSTADHSGKALQDAITKAQGLRDDLAFLIEKAEAVADRLDTGIRTSRPQAGVAPAEVNQMPSRRQPAPRPNSGQTTEAAGQPARRSAAAGGGDGGSGRAPSKTEQELMKSLQSMR